MKTKRIGLTMRMLLAAAAVLTAADLSVRAGEVHWTGGTGSWHDPINWDPGVPGGSDLVYVDGGGTARILPDQPGPAYSRSLYAGYKDTGGILHSGGRLDSSWAIFLGYQEGATGTYTLEGTGYLDGRAILVGQSGLGRFLHSSGTAHLTDDLILGSQPGARGVYDLSGTGQFSASKVYVGWLGEGTIRQSAGADAESDYLIVGHYGGSRGTYELSGTATLSARLEYIGSTGDGTFRHTGGRHEVTGKLSLGNSGTGTYELSGTAVLSAQWEYIGFGQGGTGVFTQDGGTNIVSETLHLGSYYLSTGRYLLRAGQLSAKNLIVGGEFYHTGGGAGYFSQEGGVTEVTGTLWVSSYMNSTGTYEATAGRLTAGHLLVGREGTGVLSVVGAGSQITVLGDFELGATGSLVSIVNPSGLTAFSIGGTAELDGRWEVQDAGAPYGRFDVLTASGGVSGAFDTVSLPGSEWSWGLAGGNTLWVEHVPEPSFALLAGVGLPWLLRRRRYRTGGAGRRGASAGRAAPPALPGLGALLAVRRRRRLRSRRGLCLLLTSALAVATLAPGHAAANGPGGMAPYVLAYRLDGSARKQAFGWSAAKLGDVDGDGRGDLAIGAMVYSGGANEHVSIYSQGLTHASLLSKVETVNRSDHFGHDVTGLVDVNGDGVPDWAAGAHSGEYVVWGSGADRTIGGHFESHPAVIDVKHGGYDTHYFGHSVQGLAPYGDLIEACRPNVGGVGTSAEWFVPSAGGVTLKLKIQARYHWRNDPAVRNVGDLVGNDGIDDFLLATDDDAASRGRVSLVSGACDAVGTALLADIEEFHFDGPYADACIGSPGAGQNPLAAAGDFTGDGVVDFAAASSRAHGWTGGVYFYDGQTQAFLWELAKPAGLERFRDMIENVGDVDGDGTDDLAISAGATGRPGTVLFYSPVRQSYVGSLAGESVDDAFGRSVVALGDLNGDGLGDFGIGAPSADFGGEDAGSFYVYLSVPEPATLALLGVGAIGLLRRRRARKRGLGGAAQAPLALKLTRSRCVAR